jgi:acyl-CoA synthetase (AMP-forming)/AMP-acid ligase II
MCLSGSLPPRRPPGRRLVARGGPPYRPPASTTFPWASAAFPTASAAGAQPGVRGVDMLIGDVFRGAARAVPAHRAAVLGEASITFGELDAAANRTARALGGLGIGPRDRVVTWAGTTLDALPLFAGLAKLGAIFAPVNGLLGPAEAGDMAGAARPALLVVDAEHERAAADVAAALGVPVATMAGLAEIGRAGSRSSGTTTAAGTDGVIRLAERAAGLDAGDVGAPPITERDTHVLFFTSGSTGRAKGVVLSHRVNALRTHPGSQLEPRGAMVCPYPLFHMGAWTIALQQWQARDTLVLVDRTDAATICAAVAAHRATRLNAVPAIWQRLLDHLATAGGRHDLSSLRFVDTGTSATPRELLLAIAAAFPTAHVRVFYGSTEAGNVCALDHADIADRPGSCGQPSHWQEVRIDPAGELQVRGSVVFEGYYENPEATAAAFTADGWFRTGDLAAVDDDGFVSIVGRAKDVIRTGGETVAPSEVEAALGRLPGATDVAVVGLPDTRWGEVVCAVVVADAGGPPSLDDVRAACAELAPFKRPRAIRVVDAIPRTGATLQVQRRLLVEQLLLADADR